MSDWRRVGRLAIVVVVTLAAAVAATGGHESKAAPLGGVGPGPWCGGTLWHLMTLSDRDRRTVQLHGTPSSVQDIANQVPPKHIVPRRTTIYQRAVWRLVTVVDRFRIASNGEIVLILYSISSGKYMNAYFPSQNCLPIYARNRSGMIAARNAFKKACPTPTAEWQLLGATVDIAGVGFWNPSTATRGALPNGAELRPVTNFSVLSGCGKG
jgi:hypothetical protein